MLPTAPASLTGDDGAPRAGLFKGAVAEAAFARLRGAYEASFLQRKVMEKKWQYLYLSTPQAMLALAIIDTGYLASGICAVFDRGGRKLLADENPVLPSPCVEIADDASAARLVGPGIRARIGRSGSRVEVTARWNQTEVDLTLDLSAAPPPATAIAPVGPPGRFDYTTKTALVPAEGEIRVANARFAVQNELAGLDFTHGYLARETAWRWAFGVGRQGDKPVAFNISEGFLQGEGENVAWIDGEPRALGPVRFTFTSDAPLAPWKLTGEGLDLTFQPEGYRAQTVDLKLILSRYLQPFGTFSGHIGETKLDALPGVTEDHAARW